MPRKQTPVSSASHVAQEIDALYALPLAEFTRARDALAKHLRDEGRKDEAASVKARPKPSLLAWTLNQLYRDAREDFDALLEAGDSLRKAQHGALQGEGGEAMRDAMRARREALTKLRGRARDILGKSGRGSSVGTLGRVEQSLTALANAAKRPDLGQLHDELGVPGVDDDDLFGLGALASLLPHREHAERNKGAPPAAKETRRAAPTHASEARAHDHAAAAAERERRREAAKKGAEAKVEAAREERAAADAALRLAEKAVDHAEHAAVVAGEKAESAELAAAAARTQANEAEEAAKRAQHARDEAERAAKAAAKVLDDASASYDELG